MTKPSHLRDSGQILRIVPEGIPIYRVLRPSRVAGAERSRLTHGASGDKWGPILRLARPPVCPAEPIQERRAGA